MKWTLAFVGVGLSLAAAACSTPYKYIQFPVAEGGGQVEVSKFFNDGFGVDGPAADAFKTAQTGDLAKATQIMKDAVASQPNNQWDRYDLAILYEATHEWDKAEIEIKEAIRINKAEKQFTEELAFIDKHKTVAPAPAAAKK